MGLLDALLLDPYRMNVWIAVRADHAPGTGTQNDPYDGSTGKFDSVMSALPVPVLGISYSGTTATATAICHGFTSGSSVLIAGVTNSDLYNGTFQISNATASTFQYTMSGTPPAPAQGTNMSCRLSGAGGPLVPLPLVPPVAVRLGPGTFQTNGYAEGVTGQGWLARPGMKIVGSGIDVTTLQLAGGANNAHFYAIGHPVNSAYTGGLPNLVDFFEVCDLTIDCNLAAYSGAQAACGAVRVMGNHARIRRLKVINWGTKYNLKPCFVLSAIAASDVAWVEDCGIEECIAITPATGPQGNVGPITVFHAGASEAPPATPQAYGVGPYIRNCFVDGSPSTLEIRGISMAWCKAGVMEGNQAHNVTYGTFQQATAAQDIVARNNWFKNVNKGVLLGGSSGSQVFGITNILIEGNVVELATATTGTLIGIHLNDSGASPPTFATAIVRDNKIRYVDGLNDPSYVGYPMQLNGAADLLVRNDVVEWNSNITHPVRNARCGSVAYFNNQKPTGELVQGWSDDAGNYYEELSTIADFALVMGLFNRKT